MYGAKSKEESILAEEILHTFVGSNYYNQDTGAAIELARKCPCMSWLVTICDKSTDIMDSLFAAANASGASQYYAHGLLMTFVSFSDIPREMTEIAAQMGCPLCQIIMYHKVANRYWAELAAKQGYSEGYRLLGRYREAAELGNIKAMRKQAKRCTGQERWYWLCKRHLCFSDDGGFDFLNGITVPYWELCQIGALLPKCAIARTAYLQECARVREGIDTWTMTAIRLGIYKDMRVYVAKIVWENRVYRLK